ncbi:unnamed protein product [Prorocentrum cordatum]|uniref:Uncharacterized protein n=1 Tax=Prorocentrum cordatum TaxID=2364126 RepID=A0ABN9X985_9DINO|nr:unnamed protein product [Polarella glacialis]
MENGGAPRGATSEGPLRGSFGAPEEREGAETDGGGGAASSGAQQFRRGRSDSVRLSAAAVSDIYETVQRWHDKAHCEMMRAHIRGASVPGEAPSTRGDAPPREFSVTPTLDAAEAAAFSAPEAPREPPGPSARGGAASRQLEEAQLKLALELSRAEAEADDAGAAAQATEGAAASPGAVANSPAGAPAAPVQGREQPSLPLHAESASAVAVFLKDHCLSERVDYLPDRLERSIEHVVAKMCTHSSWGLLYESLTEELGFRAKAAARALGACHARAVDADSAGARASLQHERMCLPIWRSSRDGVMAALSRLRPGGGAGPCAARRGLLRQATLEWCELEDLTEFLDGQLAPLEMQIDTFRGAQEVTSKAHTPHVRDIGRLLFRNLCLLDSRIFRPLCLAAYSLVHEVEDAAEGGAERGELVDILEGFHSMLVACDVADDHLSTSKRTKESFSEHLVAPISAAVDRLAEWDLRGHVSRDARRPDACFKG